MMTMMPVIQGRQILDKLQVTMWKGHMQSCTCAGKLGRWSSTRSVIGL